MGRLGMRTRDEETAGWFASRESRAFLFTPFFMILLSGVFDPLNNGPEAPTFSLPSSTPSISDVISGVGAIISVVGVGVAVAFLTSIWAMMVIIIPWAAFCSIFFAFFRWINHRSLPPTVAAFVVVAASFYAVSSLAYSGRSLSVGAQLIGFAAGAGTAFWFLYAGWRLRLPPDEPWT